MRYALATLVLLFACRGPAADDDGPDQGGPGTGGGDQCVTSEDCPKGSFCVAPYEGQGGPESFACVEECIDQDVEEFWCADDDACCEGLSCDMLGFCRGPGSDTETGDGDGDGDSTTTSDTGSDTGGDSTTDTTDSTGGTADTTGRGSTTDTTGTN